MISKRQSDSGVSPVIGVILMVAITVIIAAVVANFVLDLGDSLQENADATISFDQDANYGEGDYKLTITTTNMDNADYTYVQVAGGDVTEYQDTHNDRNSRDSQQVSDEDALSTEVPDDERDFAMISSGDRIVLDGLDGDEDIQIFGVLSGESNQVASYSVNDPQRFMD